MLPRPSLRKHRIHEQKELQITAFLNLMVILIPFLLLTAVFARMAAIELTLPEVSSDESKSTRSEDQLSTFRLIVSINEDYIEVLNNSTLLGIIKKDEAGSLDFTLLSDLIQQIKQQFPEEKSAVILSRPSIPYKILVETIDAIRESFPDVSLGES